jgi:hypothetical protein
MLRSELNITDVLDDRGRLRPTSKRKIIGTTTTWKLIAARANFDLNIGPHAKIVGIGETTVNLLRSREQRMEECIAIRGRTKIYGALAPSISQFDVIKTLSDGSNIEYPGVAIAARSISRFFGGEFFDRDRARGASVVVWYGGR